MPLPRLAPALALTLAAALAAPPPAAASPVPVVATFGVIADSATRLAGDCAEVSALVPAGGDPHLYEATPGDVRRLQQAGLVLYLGLGLEGRLAAVLERLGARQPVVGLGAAIPPGRLATDAQGATDPHVWMDPAIWAEVLPALAAALAAAAPDCADRIAAAAAAHAAELRALAAWSAASLATIPPEARVLVTAHDAFGYFGRAYGLEVEAIQGLSTEAEPSVADIRAVAELVAARRVPAVFVETTINPRTIETMVAAARDRGHAVALGPALYADAMGPEGTPEGTLIGMTRANIAAIAGALGGAALPLPAELGDWAQAWGLAQEGR
ncbi:MAG: zinc ABC transporter substrate-binding protein [Rhodobacteraceae bacterium]|jgi:manganese/zinc/iron transport system substrate-binding protein|nr:zinc ABC transporter substrate-binding protein [Paracoccaceae bacterium]